MATETKVNLVLHQLREMIASGEFGEKGKLPAERELSHNLHASRDTLRKALSTLEAEGMIWRHVGQGTFLGSKPPENPMGSLSVSDQTNPTEIMEMRLILEPKMAALAAERANHAEIEKMIKAARRCEESNDQIINQKWDLVLHETIAQASRNSLVISVFRSVNQLRTSDLWGRLNQPIMVPEKWVVFSKQHDGLVQAIKERDPALAERIMRTHLEEVRREILKAI